MKHILLLFAILCFSTTAFAAPEIADAIYSAPSNNIVIYGSSFGTKSVAAPEKWDNFEDGDYAGWNFFAGNDSSWSVVSSINRQGSDYSAHKMNSGTNYWMGFTPSRVSNKNYTCFYMKISSTLDINNNSIKYARFGGTSSCNLILTSNGSRFNQTIEFANPSTAVDWGDYSISSLQAQWRLIEIEWAVPINGSTENYARVWVDGELSNELTDRFWDGENWDTNLYAWYGAWFNANLGTGLGDGVWFDDIYYDVTPARVMIGNNSTFSASNHREIQIPTAWSSSEITVQLNQGSYQNGDQVYLFVIDASGNVSPGYAFTIGGESEDDTNAPAISGTSPARDQTNVPRNTNVSFVVSDAGDGVDRDSMKLYIDDVEMAVTITGDASAYTVTTSNQQTFDYGQIVDIKIDAQDLATTPNVMTQVQYTFTIEQDTEVGRQFAVGDEGNADNYTEKTSSRWETADDSGDVVYKINTTDITTAGERMGEYVLYNGATYEEFDVRLEARSDEDLGANGYADYGIVFGYQDTDNYYYVLFNSHVESNDLYRIQDGVRSELATFAGALVDDNEFHTSRVRYKGTAVTIYFDGAQVMSLESVVLASGAVGFGSYNDAASFDDVVITDLGEGPAIEDVDASGTVDATDVGIVVDQSIGRSGETTADVDSSGTVDSRDVQQVVNAFE